MVNYVNNYIVICFFHEQAKQWELEDMKTFLVDANYKHLAGAGQREIIWSWYSQSSQKGS
jgi:hypothetical protein